MALSGNDIAVAPSEDSETAQIRSLDRPPNPYRLSFTHGKPQKADEHASIRPRRRRKGVTSATGSSESGTEADDETENRSFVKALPAPHVRPRKGLKVGEDDDALIDPSQLDDEGRRIDGEGFTSAHYASEVEEQEILFKRRLNEAARRGSEVALMAVMLLVVLCGRGVWTVVKIWKFELLVHVLTMIGLVAAYPVKLSLIDARSAKTKFWQRFRVPASFDPATVLYPPLLPVMVALTVSPLNPTLVLPNIMLGLSSLPQRLFPRSTRVSGFNTLHWLVSLLPLVVGTSIKWAMSMSSTQDFGLSQETLVSLYPLHHALLQPLIRLTTNSLLISEQHLLSVALINLLLFARAPQSTILKACLWIGGLTLYACTDRVLHWNVTLARVPRWKLRRPGHSDAERRSLIDAVADVINLQRAASAFQKRKKSGDSDADEDYDPVTPITKARNPRIQKLFIDEQPVASDDSSVKQVLRPNKPRRHTIPGSRPQAGAHDRKRRRTHIPWCLQLTPDQADRRKLAYAVYTYTVILSIILIPVRMYVSTRALHNAEAIGWAIGYLFGQIPQLADTTRLLGLQNWIALPPTASLDFTIFTPITLPLDISGLRTVAGAANTHLILIAYWVVVLTAGLVAVFTLTPYVEVDTRRKVFHGVMVAMFLPATFVDPCYCALALSLVLTIFLLLEVIRAAQVPPLGTAIGRFIAPYVDGRDLRGPIVVSHLFLAIGCAVPLWFSLAGLARQNDTVIWKNWETFGELRDVGMLAGVICVGMGDAAASLIGRRYGRRKWVWVGGKSLEGSAAFAAAVTLGLLFGKIWLWVGGWNDLEPMQHTMLGWSFWLARAVLCACGASFLEAVLTGANDNVACPICLWLLVKGMRL